MAYTYKLIEAKTLSGTVSSVTFSSIPSTYTDLLLKASVRGGANTVNQSYEVTFNGTSTTGHTMRRLYANGSTVGSDTTAYIEGVGSTATASIFSYDEIYISNYTGSTNKSFIVNNVSENNATTAYAMLQAGLRSNTDAVTSIVLTALGTGGSFAQYSTFYLYGIKNS